MQTDKLGDGSSDDPFDVAILQLDSKHPLVDALG